MPRKHFYPRQPPSPQDGPDLNGKLVTRRDGNTRLTECAIPRSAMPEVKGRLDAGQTVKFSFHVDWMEHWGNELEFGMEPKR